MNFKKITAIATSVLMAGMTVGIASAANYPAPFVESGTANVAVVYGTGAGVSSLDMVQAGNIQTSLGTYVTGTTTVTSTDGDVYKLEKTSTKFNLGDSIADVVSTTIDNDELPTLLKDGVFIDNDNDEFDFTQKVTLANLTLNMWEDNDYKADEPVTGIRIANGAHVLNYTLDFTDEPEWADLVTADLTLMGKEYYVLSNSSTVGESLTLLDSAVSTVLTEGESATVAGKSVSISFIGSTPEVKLSVDGETTNTLGEGETYKLKDGSYLGIKDILYSSKEGTLSKVEFSIGNGKLLLTSGSDVELNENSISDLTAFITNSSTKLSTITLQWSADDDLFVAEDSDVIMPGFGAIKLSYGGLNYPAEENLMVENSGDDSIVLNDFPIKDSTEDINILYFNGTNYTLVGKDSDNLLRTGTTNITFDGDTDDWFVASWTDGQDSESYLMRATNFKNESGTQRATFEYRSNGAWSGVKTDAEPADEISIGNVEFTVVSLNRTAKTASLGTTTSGVNFNTLYSKEGMKVYLPWLNETAMDFYNTTNVSATTACSWLASTSGSQLGYTQVVSYNDTTTNVAGTANTTTCTNHPATYSLIFSEEDKNENIGAGQNITLTLADDASNKVSVTNVVGTIDGTFTEMGDTDIYRNFVYSELATEMLWDKSADQYKVKLVYHGDEVTADLYVSSAEATMSTGGAIGDILVKDSEVNSVSSKNLVIVGGSCINSAAATALGLPTRTCGEAFTMATGVGAGEFLIKGVEDAFMSGKLALVVAGYDAADTANAATYLTKKTVDTSKEYKGTSETTAEMVVA
ncbi:hypothetical protein GW932_00020 [archaeon]|nr:hypothetical protein [archaeon]